MTPKEKAIQLVDRFSTPLEGSCFQAGKECALIAVDEMIESITRFTLKGKRHPMCIYYNEVKKEIEKL